VTTPVEGTILTVGRRASEALDSAILAGPIAVLESASLAAAEAVAHTPSQLAILRQAGVVDAGGEGLSTVLDAALRSLRGEPLEDDSYAPAPAILDTLDLEHEQGFGYCTQLLVEGVGLDVATVRQDVTGLGESAMVVGDAELIRVHVHTQRPGRVVDYLTDIGTLRDVRIDNMDQQFRDRRAVGGVDTVVHRRSGVVAVASGSGLRRVLTSFGARVVDGGPTANPSTEELLAAINLVAAESVVVLPNNGNVKLAAQHAAGLCERPAQVLATRNVVEGIAALIAFNAEADLETNLTTMRSAVAQVRSAEVTTAVRAARVGSLEIRQGSLIGLIDDEVVVSADGLRFLVLELLDRLGAGEAEILTLYQGADLDALTLDDVVQAVKERYTRQELEVVDGGQPLYPLLIAVE
jgi:DAK2 domain fusion protein YloV